MQWEFKADRPMPAADPRWPRIRNGLRSRMTSFARPNQRNQRAGPEEKAKSESGKSKEEECRQCGSNSRRGRIDRHVVGVCAISQQTYGEAHCNAICGGG